MGPSLSESMAPGRMTSSMAGRPRQSRLRGAARHRGSHRDARAWVRAPSLVGRSEDDLAKDGVWELADAV